MKHIMRLHPQPFDMIINGTKTAECRLYDDKRRQIHIGDQITFLKRPTMIEYIDAIVDDLKVFKSFEQINSKIELSALGFDSSATSQDCIKCYRRFYSPEDEKKFGVLFIEFSIVNSIEK